MTLSNGSVQDIRGKFENWKQGQKFPNSNNYTNVLNSRPRSLSVTDNAINRQHEVITRNNSLSKRNGDYPNNFADKQKLVENIVSNIKNSSYSTKCPEYHNRNNNTNLVSEKYKQNNRQYKLNNELNKENDSYIYHRSKFNEDRNAKNDRSMLNDNLYSSKENEDMKPKSEILNKILFYDKVNRSYGDKLNLGNGYINFNDNTSPLNNNDNGDENSYIKRNNYVNENSGNQVYEIKRSQFVDHYSLEEPERPPRRRIGRKKTKAPPVPQDCSSRMSKYSSDFENMQTAGNYDTYPIKYASNSYEQPLSHIAVQSSLMSDSPVEETNENNLCGRMPNGPPPKKPPRTFAHDIYKQSKLSRQDTSNSVDALYSKPTKKKKNYDENFHSLNTINFREKPPIAPKPPHITFKRHSVIEPLESSNGNDIEKAVIKRNTSFRFSIRKQVMPIASSKQLAKLKEAVKVWNFRKDPEEKNNKFRSEEALNRSECHSPSHIYATPYSKKSANGSCQELHYMCSPLFPMEENNIKEREEQLPKVKKTWGGLKNEFRQSCRFVHKKLKKTIA